MIIVASERYRDEMIDELQKNEIYGYVCTWYGLRLGRELNIVDKRFPEEFRRDIELLEKKCFSTEKRKDVYTYFAPIRYRNISVYEFVNDKLDYTYQLTNFERGTAMFDFLQNTNYMYSIIVSKKRRLYEGKIISLKELIDACCQTC